MLHIDAGLNFNAGIMPPVQPQYNGQSNYASAGVNGIFDFAGNTTSNLLNFAGNTTAGLLDFAGNTTQGALNLAGNVASGSLNFAGQTLNNSFNLLGNILNGGYGGNSSNLSLNAGLSMGQGGSAAPSAGLNVSAGLGGVMQGLGGTLQGLGGLARGLSGSLLEVSKPLYAMSARQMQRDIAMFNAYGGPFGCGYLGFRGYGIGPYGINLIAALNSPMYGYNPMMYGYNPMMQSYNPMMQGYNPMMQGYNPYSIGTQNNNSLQPLDKILYPEKYSKEAAKKEDKDTKPVETADPRTGKPNTPNWYADLALKAEKKEPLTENEKNLKNSFEKLVKNHSPFRLDKEGQYVLDSEGKPIKSSLGDEITELQILLEAGNTEQVEQKLKALSPEKLAAIEAWFPDITGKPLREYIKTATLHGNWFSWTGYNTDSANRMFDILDRSALNNPHNMAESLYQALNNHRMFGFGVDDDRVAKLLKMTSANPEFLAAVKKQYRGSLDADIAKKWFISDENKNIINSIMYKVPDKA